MKSAYRYCPRCSAPLADGEKFGRVRRHCRYCGFIHFVEPKVAVAGLVTNGQRILLVKRAASPRIGYWALPAGYMDVDELPEEALAREVAEETGIRISSPRLQGVAPLAGWDERRGILLLYRAEADGGAIAAGDDVSDARWFARGEVPWDALAFESTAEFVRGWVSEIRGGE